VSKFLQKDPLFIYKSTLPTLSQRAKNKTVQESVLFWSVFSFISKPMLPNLHWYKRVAVQNLLTNGFYHKCAFWLCDVRIVRLNQGSPNYGLRAKCGPRSHFIRPPMPFCQWWKY